MGTAVKVIIDCDPGNGVPGANVDDAIALTVALRAPEIDVRAVWTVFGNTTAQQGREAASRLFGQLRAGTPTLRQGCDTPLSGAREQWRDRLDAPGREPLVRQLWGAARGVSTRDASRAPDPLHPLVSDLRDAGAGVTLACLGPLTNIAQLVRSEPSALEGVDRICLMGGALKGEDLVDTNFAVDPDAADVVLRCGIPLTVVPLDVTRTTCLTVPEWNRMRTTAVRASMSVAGEVAGWLEPWLEYSRRTRPVDGMWLHDLVVVAMLLDPSVVQTQTTRVNLLRSPAGKLALDEAGVTVDLVQAVDNEALLRILARSLAIG
ncbi:MAG: nucleoside hydrolase [Propionibacterium sp.]|nr:nucleoside hydrolase [Propionibacterium sp.]